MDQLLVTQQGVDAAYRSPNNVSRLGPAAEDSHPPKKSAVFLPIKLSVGSPLLPGWSIFSLTPSLCVLRCYSFAIYSFPRVDHPQLCRRVHRQVLEAFTRLRCVVVRLYPSL